MIEGDENESFIRIKKGYEGYKRLSILFFILFLLVGISFFIYVILTVNEDKENNSPSNQSVQGQEQKQEEEYEQEEEQQQEEQEQEQEEEKELEKINEERTRASKEGLKIIDQNNYKSGITIISNFFYANVIYDDASYTEEFKLAFDLEVKSNPDIYVNGERIYGRIFVDNDIISFYDAKNNLRTFQISDMPNITCGGKEISQNTINLMNNLYYEEENDTSSTSRVFFKNFSLYVSYNENKTLNMDYKICNITILNKTFINVTQIGELYYEGDSLIENNYQNIIKEFDKQLDIKYPDTKDWLIQETIPIIKKKKELE